MTSLTKRDVIHSISENPWLMAIIQSWATMWDFRGKTWTNFLLLPPLPLPRSAAFAEFSVSVVICWCSESSKNKLHNLTLLQKHKWLSKPAGRGTAQIKIPLRFSPENWFTLTKDSTPPCWTAVKSVPRAKKILSLGVHKRLGKHDSIRRAYSAVKHKVVFS